MPSRSSFRFEGAKELERALKALGPEVATEAGATGTRKATNVMRDALKERAPKRSGSTLRKRKGKDGNTSSVDYGHLRDNIKTRKVKARAKQTVSYVVTTGRAFWGRFSEFGTEHEPARPWFRPTLDQTAGKVIAALSDELRKAIDAAARKAKK